MARKYSERIESMDADSREEFDTRIREYHGAQGWQKTLAKFKPSPIQLRAILAGKDATKAKAKAKKKPKAKPEVAAPKAAKKKAKKAAKKKTAKKKRGRPKTTASAAPKPAKKKPGRPKGSGKKKAGRKNGVAKADLIIEGKIDATQFMQMILDHSERMLKMAQA